MGTFNIFLCILNQMERKGYIFWYFEHFKSKVRVPRFMLGPYITGPTVPLFFFYTSDMGDL